MALLIIFLILVGVCLWLLRDRMNGTIQTLIITLMVLMVVLYILGAFGIISVPPQLQIGKH